MLMSTTKKQTKCSRIGILPLSKKLGRVKKEKLSTLRNKADKLLQEVVRKNHPYCEVCGQPTSCGHHYFPKSTCTALRYDLDNIIPLCQKHHFFHHNGNPEIHNTVNMIRGLEWLEDLTAKKYNLLVKPDAAWYKVHIEELKSML